MPLRITVALPALGAAGLALYAGPAASARIAAPNAHAARTTAVGVSEREYRIVTFRSRARRGIVKFNVTNRGEDTHDFAVIRGGTELTTTGDVRSGRRATLSVSLKPGRYRLICTLSDHAQQGMRANFTVTT
jgi:plastocyanin